MQYKKCECSPECNTMIPIINSRGKPARIARGHNFKGENNPSFVGRQWLVNGYRKVYAPNHPFRDGHGYVLEHRLIMEQYLGRYLRPEEHIHHRDGNKLNNDISNLELTDRPKHSKITAKTNPQCQKKDLSGRICLECKSDNTKKASNGQPHWMFHPITKQGYVCERCYRRIKHNTQTNVKYRRVNISNRLCSTCNRNKSEAKNGKSLWYRDGAGGWLCKNCYNKKQKDK